MGVTITALRWGGGSFNFYGDQIPPFDYYNYNTLYEGSQDVRNTVDGGTQRYHQYNATNQGFSEKANIFTHTVENPYVDGVSIKLQIDRMYDTIEQTLGQVENPSRNAGENIPTVMNLLIETGFIAENGGKHVLARSKFIFQ